MKLKIVSRPFITGAVVLEISCFSEAERLYMLAKDTTVNDKPLTAVVIPAVLVGSVGYMLGKTIAILQMQRVSISKTWAEMNRNPYLVVPEDTKSS